MSSRARGSLPTRSPIRPVVAIATAPRIAPAAYSQPISDCETPRSLSRSGISTCSVPPTTETRPITSML